MVMGELTQDTQLVVIGGGPGGYAAAFRAADLGLEVTLVNAEPRLGGVCLLRGCIPSKTLLYLTQLVNDVRRAEAMGITYGAPQVDLAAIRRWKDKVIDKLVRGLDGLAKQRGVQVIEARAEFESSEQLRLHGSEIAHLRFKQAIIATGSTPITPPGMESQPGGRVLDSTGALELPDIPQRLLVVGGGYVGMELGSVYAALGSKVTVVEMADRLLVGADRDLARPLLRRIEATFEKIYLKAKVAALQESPDYVDVTLEGADIKEPQQRFDRVLVSVGRRPNSAGLGLEHTQVQLNPRGFIQVNEEMRTADPQIFAIGDVVGGMMLAHKAMREGKVAAEVIAGQPSAFDVRAIPAVVYTDPQLAWAGLTEEEAAKAQRPIKVARFPWSASGRATTMGESEGLTKMIIEPESQRIIGFGIVGRDAGEMIAEGVLAVEMGALAEDVALSIHPHPTLSETEGEVAELFLGGATHILGKVSTSR